MMGSPAYLVVTAVIVHHGIFVDDLVADFLPLAHFGLLVDPKVLAETNPDDRLESTKSTSKRQPLETFFMRGKPQQPNPSQNIFPTLDATNFPIFFFGTIYLFSQSQWLLMAKRWATRSMYRRKPLTRSSSSTLGRLIPYLLLRCHDSRTIQDLNTPTSSHAGCAN